MRIMEQTGGLSIMLSFKDTGNTFCSVMKYEKALCIDIPVFPLLLLSNPTPIFADVAPFGKIQAYPFGNLVVKYILAQLSIEI
jgi:hypothetical protein